jgi:hypothetical protein
MRKNTKVRIASRLSPNRNIGSSQKPGIAGILSPVERTPRAVSW